jgi:hypothetical protein
MLSTVRSLAAAAALILATAVPALAGQRPPAEQVTSRNSPAMVGGLWCGAGLLHNYVLEIAQQYQRVNARLIKRNRSYELTGRMEGAILRADPQRDHTIDLEADGDELRIIGGTGVLAMARGQFFTRAVGGSCTH